MFQFTSTSIGLVIGFWVVLLLGLAIKIVKQYQRGVILRFGKLIMTRDPGFNLILPIVDRMAKVDLRVVTMVVEPQAVITKDNVTIKVDAVVYFKVIDPVKAVLQVQDYMKATTQIALTTLRSVLGQSDLDELLFEREKINKKLGVIIDSHTEPWGIMVDVVEVKDVQLPRRPCKGPWRGRLRQRERKTSQGDSRPGRIYGSRNSERCGSHYLFRTRGPSTKIPSDVDRDRRREKYHRDSTSDGCDGSTAKSTEIIFPACPFLSPMGEGWGEGELKRGRLRWNRSLRFILFPLTMLGGYCQPSIFI